MKENYSEVCMIHSVSQSHYEIFLELEIYYIVGLLKIRLC